jgi:hypothetical protein
VTLTPGAIGGDAVGGGALGAALGPGAAEAVALDGLGSAASDSRAGASEAPGLGAAAGVAPALGAAAWAVTGAAAGVLASRVELREQAAITRITAAQHTRVIASVVTRRPRPDGAPQPGAAAAVAQRAS